ncbi:MAG TPA: indole-3-glycerol phosphate synthase TrpC [Pyrinomonadaceae bacterium]|nr:indole-3-glycerol phosphate synthase TrpC [Pyrinomonadaceae bacterium]
MERADFLEKIIARRRTRLSEEKSLRPLEVLRAEAERERESRRTHAFRAALTDSSTVNVIAEFKRASPSKGVINGAAEPGQVARAYETGGAAAVSVLTEQDFFGGSLADLREVRAAARLPVLRKDFVFDEYQVYEAAAAGADAVLLIAAALDDATLLGLRRLAEDSLGLDALVEVHDGEEMRRAEGAGARLVGVNNRNLRTFEVRLETSEALAGLAPAGAVLVSESGINTREDVSRLRACGYGAFLVGESLMRSGRPAEALRVLRGDLRGELPGDDAATAQAQKREVAG